MTAEVPEVNPSMKRHARTIGSPTEPTNARPATETPTEVPEGARSYTIHFVDDGLTTLGRVWYRGQTLTVVEGTRDWDRVHDVNGDTFMTLTEDEQLERYGKRYFREGPWTGKGFDLNDPNLTDEERKTLERAQRKNQPQPSMRR